MNEFVQVTPCSNWVVLTVHATHEYNWFRENTVTPQLDQQSQNLLDYNFDSYQKEIIRDSKIKNVITIDYCK